MGKFFLFLFLTTFMALSLQAQNNIWNRHVIDSTLSGADGVRLADVNNDNLMDITTGWEEGGYTKVYVHPGYNLTTQKWPSVIVGKTPDVEDAVFVDIDNDGRIDVVSSTEGKNRKIYFNWAPTDPLDYLDSSKWNTQTLPASDGPVQWMFAFPAQIDGKNGNDLVVGSKNKEAKIGWFQAPTNTRNLSDWKWYPIGSATWIMSIIIRDMDNDGDMDIVTSDRKPGATNGVRWLENPGKIENQKQEWDNHLIGCEGLEVMFMDMADMDGDGLEDAIVTEYTNQKIVYMKRLNKNGLEWKSYNIHIPKITGRAKAVKIGDIDGDGNPDIVHSTNTLNDPNKSGIYWLSYRNNPSDPMWDWHELSGPKGIKFDRIELLDLDGDGDLDVLTCEENYGANSQGLGVIWYENPFNKAVNNR
ncbi:VCBS repeat-containing protein [Arenibacter sp. F20364]|uniref:FG-GAP repeat domain-containing protein n=1 Tax=Arenibacter sp. F20364 TaxID=2926415 RepID=UPI001FF3B0DA|nr:VCBS repeat-containing protein [Arenibacter sp. F20364]MCK0191470.1 VCBS repeat-containing protein [Arenibacter sp. F20364]